MGTLESLLVLIAILGRRTLHRLLGRVGSFLRALGSLGRGFFGFLRRLLHEIRSGVGGLLRRRGHISANLFALVDGDLNAFLRGISRCVGGLFGGVHGLCACAPGLVAGFCRVLLHVLGCIRGRLLGGIGCIGRGLPGVLGC